MILVDSFVIQPLKHKWSKKWKNIFMQFEMKIAHIFVSSTNLVGILSSIPNINREWEKMNEKKQKKKGY